MRETLDDVTIIRSRMYVPRTQSAIRRGLYELSFMTLASAVRLVDRPHVVIGIVPNLGGGVAAAFHAFRYRVPLGLIVQDLAGTAAEQSGIPGSTALVVRVTRGLERWVLRQAAYIATVSDGFRRYIEQAGVPRERILTLPNWTRTPAPTQSKEEARRELGWPQDKEIILHAGNMGLKQGLIHVLEAAAEAQTSHPNLLFVLMGDGNQRQALQAWAAPLPNVLFQEPRYGSDLDYANALGAADVLLINERSTVKEMSLPSKLTSYLMAGRPILAAVVPEGTTAHEIRRAGAGLVVRPADAKALLDAAESLLSDPDVAERHATAGRSYATAVLTESRGLVRTEQFVAEVLATRRQRA